MIPARYKKDPVAVSYQTAMSYVYYEREMKKLESHFAKETTERMTVNISKTMTMMKKAYPHHDVTYRTNKSLNIIKQEEAKEMPNEETIHIEDVKLDWLCAARHSPEELVLGPTVITAYPTERVLTEYVPSI